MVSGFNLSLRLGGEALKKAMNELLISSGHFPLELALLVTVLMPRATLSRKI